MSWLTAAAVQLVITSVTLGALKKSGVITVDSRRIDNPTLRSLFDGAVDLGADAAGRATKLWDTLAK